MQPADLARSKSFIPPAFSTAQPTAALVEPQSNAGSGTFGDASADTTTTAVDGQWTTRVYHGWAGPSSQM